MFHVYRDREREKALELIEREGLSRGNDSPIVSTQLRTLRKL
jgi:hypothetical protein